jgi:hypothetical protein
LLQVESCNLTDELKIKDTKTRVSLYEFAIVRRGFSPSDIFCKNRKFRSHDSAYHILEPASSGGRGMQLTAAGRAHVAKKKASLMSLRPADVVNKEIADKRKRDKACEFSLLIIHNVFSV